MMRSAFAYRYDKVRNIRTFFGAVVLLGLLTTTLMTITMMLPLFDSADYGDIDSLELEQALHLSRNKTGGGEVPVTVVPPPHLQSTSAVKVPSSFDPNNRMNKQAFTETAVLPLESCSFTMETIQNVSDTNNVSDETDTAARTRTPRTRNKPIWLPGYPGSGSELLRDLVHTMAGDPTAAADIYKDVVHRCQTAITCKTHWPAYPHHAPDLYRETRTTMAAQQQQQQQYHYTFAPNVILLLRNPATALASHFNFKWETEHDVADHTAQAPQADWMTWRNQRFARQINNWKQMILQWHSGGGTGTTAGPYYRVTLYLPYERLVSPRDGPVCAAKLADELRQAGALTVVATNDIPCVWRTVVMDQPRKQRQSHRNDHRYQPSYTPTQQQMMVHMLQDIMLQLPDQVGLNEILTEYVNEIQMNLRIDD